MVISISICISYQGARLTALREKQEKYTILNSKKQLKRIQDEKEFVPLPRSVVAYSTLEAVRV